MYVSLQISSVFSSLADETLNPLANSLEKMKFEVLNNKASRTQPISKLGTACNTQSLF